MVYFLRKSYGEHFVHIHNTTPSYILHSQLQTIRESSLEAKYMSPTPQGMQQYSTTSPDATIQGLCNYLQDNTSPAICIYLSLSCVWVPIPPFFLCHPLECFIIYLYVSSPSLSCIPKSCNNVGFTCLLAVCIRGYHPPKITISNHCTSAVIETSLVEEFIFTYFCVSYRRQQSSLSPEALCCC